LLQKIVRVHRTWTLAGCPRSDLWNGLLIPFLTTAEEGPKHSSDLVGSNGEDRIWIRPDAAANAPNG